MKSTTRSFAIVGAVALAAALAPLAAADAVYHSERLELASVAGAPLRSGFVLNSKAQGPRVYAHEIYVLNGAAPNAEYTFKRDFYVANCGCKGEPSFSTPVGWLETNAAGNAKDDLRRRSGRRAGVIARRKHGVRWHVEDAAGRSSTTRPARP